MQPIIRLKYGTETFDVVKLMASEVKKIQAWTGLPSKSAWINALGSEDIDAFVAGYVLMKQRAGADLRFDDVDFDTDEMSAVMVDPASGREIEPVLVRDKDGDPVLNAKKEPVVVKDKAGQPTWRFVDDGSPVPPTEEPSTKPGSTAP